MILGPESPCFVELDEAVMQLQKERGDDRPVVFHWQSEIDKIPENAIIYNLDLYGVHFSDNEMQLGAARASEIWDFSPRGVNAWLELGIPAKHAPLGYHPSMERFERSPNPDIDVAFAGCLNPRRQRIFSSLEKHGLKIAFAPVDRAGRNALLARCRTSINMRFYESGVYPMLRALHLHANRVPFVGEVSDESEQDLACPMWSSYENLVDAVRDAVAHPLRDGYDVFKSGRMVLPA